MRLVLAAYGSMPFGRKPFGRQAFDRQTAIAASKAIIEGRQATFHDIQTYIRRTPVCKIRKLLKYYFFVTFC